MTVENRKVVTAAIVSRNIADAVSVQEIDVEKLLEIVQKTQLNHHDSSDESDSSEERDNSDNNALKKFINNISNNYKNPQEKPNIVRLQKYDSQNSHRSEDIGNILSLILNNDLKVEPKQKSYPVKKRLTPNRLLWDGKDKNSDLQDYSKIYVLLTPNAIQKAKFSSSGINDLVSKILSLSTSSTNRNRQVPQKQKRYKGFVVNEPVQRRRGSREMYAPNDSVEDKPKRGRNNGGGGHTAIPYIRHRGDNIYEKES
ncbi:unnamed protein product [Arctia plantaginis]|uniref:Uncharacterized protein n=1 Tax=Arctia plantaginis TaxID=874455 RepID=A0A8S1A3Y3_ARCPL|nr:unnamed protein product [Arctia plantaginis]